MNTKTNTKNKKKLMLGTMAGTMALTGVAGTVAPLLNGEATVVEAYTLETYGDFQYFENGDGTVTLDKYLGSDAEVRTPKEINGLPVTVIDSEAFGSSISDSVLKVIVSEGVTTLKTGVFRYSNIQEVYLPNSLNSIGYETFREAPITKVGIKNPNLTLSLSDNYFYGVSGHILYGYEGSTTETYAQGKGYTFRPYSELNPDPILEPEPEEGTGGTTETGTSGNEQTNDVTANIINGDLLLDPVTIDNFGDIPLTTDASVNYASITSPLTVTDNRGTQEGWTLNVSATPFASADHTLPAGSLTLKGVESVTATSTTPGIAPSNTLSATTVIDDGSVVVAEALTGEGAGVFEIAFPQDALALTVDSSTAKIGNYNSTITWTLASTPTGN